MKNFALKCKAIERQIDRLDHFVWKGFHKYIEHNKIMFNGPQTWRIFGDEIVFDGTDGCRGCYDSKQISIPISWFEDK